MGEVVRAVVVQAFKQPCIFGYFLGWEIGRCAVAIADSTLVALVEAQVSLVVSLSSSSREGLLEYIILEQ